MEKDFPMKFKSGLITVIFLSITLVTISVSAQCKSYEFLRQGFNWDNYENCQKLIHQCPRKGLFPDISCVMQVAKESPVCSQFRILSEVLGGDPSVITAEAKGPFAVVDHAFAADGQHGYYILSPQGCILDTNVDPFNLNAALKEHYEHVQVVIVNWDKPQFESLSDGTQSFTVLLKVTKNCLACEVIGWAKIRFDFTKDGEFIKTNILSFNRENKNL